MLVTPVKFNAGYKASRKAKESSNPMQSCSQSQIPHLFRSRPQLRQRRLNLETRLLLQSHDLEPLEIRQSSSLLLLAALLGPRTLLPLCLNTSLLPLRLDNTSSCTPRELLENEGCENELCKSDRLTWNGDFGVCCWSIDEGLYVCEHLTLESSTLQDYAHTRLWSMISTIVASLPADSPPWMSTIRPTSTSLHDDALISASPIVN